MESVESSLAGPGCRELPGTGGEEDGWGERTVREKPLLNYQPNAPGPLPLRQENTHPTAIWEQWPQVGHEIRGKGRNCGKTLHMKPLLKARQDEVPLAELG